MSDQARSSTLSSLIEAVLITARLSAAEQQTLFAAITDTEEVVGALHYLRQTPTLLSTSLDLQDFYKSLGTRWHTSAEVARDICVLHSLSANDGAVRHAAPQRKPDAEVRNLPETDRVPQSAAGALEEQPASQKSPAPTPENQTEPDSRPAKIPSDQGEQPSVAQSSPARPSPAQLDPVQAVPELPIRTGDEAISVVSKDAEESARTAEMDSDVLGLLRQGVGTLQALALAQNLEPAALRAQVGALTHDLEEFGDSEHGRLIGSAWDFVQAFSDEQLLNILTIDPETDDETLNLIAPHMDSLTALNALLQTQTTAADLATELHRLRGPGFKWTFPALQEEIQTLGYEGPDISDPEALDTLTLGQAGNVLTYLRRIHGAHRPARKVIPAPEEGAPPRASLNKRKERVEYIESILERRDVVYTNELSGPFGVNGTSVSSLLREYGYEAIGGGGYRKKRQK